MGCHRLMLQVASGLALDVNMSPDRMDEEPLVRACAPATSQATILDITAQAAPMMYAHTMELINMPGCGGVRLTNMWLQVKGCPLAG